MRVLEANDEYFKCIAQNIRRADFLIFLFEAYIVYIHMCLLVHMCVFLVFVGALIQFTIIGMAWSLCTRMTY